MIESLLGTIRNEEIYCYSVATRLRKAIDDAACFDVSATFEKVSSRSWAIAYGDETYAIEEMPIPYKPLYIEWSIGGQGQTERRQFFGHPWPEMFTSAMIVAVDGHRLMAWRIDGQPGCWTNLQENLDPFFVCNIGCSGPLFSKEELSRCYDQDPSEEREVMRDRALALCLMEHFYGFGGETARSGVGLSV
jgi:hypothetical protein